ncbi:hypothetical protein KKB55_06015 [Myxococcota bacterium]|nr:hypothetical protein [Myxococcota bacterium]MBU1897307.1 hypothetical protein [Myxococcota bacterium]
MRVALTCALALALLPGAARGLVEVEGEAAGLTLMGSARHFMLYQRGDVVAGPFKVHLDDLLSLDRGRLMLEGWYGALNLKAAVDGVLGVGQGAQGGAASLAVGRQTQLRLFDLSQTKANTPDLRRVDVDQLVLALTSDRLELRVGRQALSHGSERLFPSTDVFAPNTGYDLDTEYKRGVDAARITARISDVSEVEIIAVAHSEDMARGLYLVRGRTTLKGVDVSILAGQTYQEPTLALDLQGEVQGAGWYLGALSRPGLEPFEAGLRATLGLTYKWAWGLTATAEGHYNGAGEADGQRDPFAVPLLTYEVGEASFIGRRYGGVHLSYEWTPLLSPSLAYFQSLSDGSLMVMPSLRWDVGQETAMDLGAMLGGGGADSELGNLPALYYGNLRLYF